MNGGRPLNLYERTGQSRDGRLLFLISTIPADLVVANERARMRGQFKEADPTDQTRDLENMRKGRSRSGPGKISGIFFTSKYITYYCITNFYFFNLR